MALSDLLNIQISIAAAKAQGFNGFGVPLILSHSPPAGFNPRTTRSYSSLTGVAVDYAATTPEYLAAQAFFSQTPQPPTLKIGAGTTKPTQQFSVSVPLVQANTNYNLNLIDTAGVTHLVSFASGATPSVASILSGLQTAITTLGLALNTAIVGGVTLTVTAQVAGTFWGLNVADLTLLAVAQTHADPGVAADLTAINAADSVWYFPIMLFPSTAVVQAVAAWAEPTGQKLYIQASLDSIIATTAKSGATDVAAVLQTAAYTRSSIWYNPFNTEFFDAGLIGVLATFAPGSYTAAWKTVAGVSPGQALTETWRTNILAKGANCYETIAQVNITEGATVAEGEYIDVVQFRDWLQNTMQIDLFNLFTSTPKVPYTDDGYGTVKAHLLADLQAGVDAGGLATFPKPSVSVPLASSRNAADRGARNFTGITFQGQLAGAVHAVNPLIGTLVQ